MKKDIRATELIDALGNIDDELLAEVGELRQEYLTEKKPQKRTRAVITWIGSLAASFAIVIAAGAFFVNSSMFRCGSSSPKEMASDMASGTTSDMSMAEDMGTCEEAAEENGISYQLTLTVEEVLEEKSSLRCTIGEIEEAGEEGLCYAGEVVFVAMESDWSMEYKTGDQIQVTFEEQDISSDEDTGCVMIFPNKEPELQPKD
ncbi:MAG: hypothetical protein ACI4F0_07140 [Agathobacter sp.]